MQNKNSLLTVALAIVCVFSLSLAFVSFQNFRKMELSFNEKKARLVKENLDLKDRIDSLQATVSKKSDSLDVFEKENQTLTSQLAHVRSEYRKILETYANQINTLRKKRVTLKKRISTLEKVSLVDYIKNSLAAQEDSNIRKVLTDALNKIELIKEGKSVNLEPIVVTKKEEPFPPQPAPPGEEISQTGQAAQPRAEEAAPITATAAPKAGRRGIILSLDRQNNLIVVNLGRRDEMKEGDRISVLKEGRQIAGAEIMSVRYRIAAAFVDDIKYGYTINEIKENDRVIAAE
jgi:hypothetical protein